MSVDVNALLDDAAKATAQFLHNWLPELTDDDWWERRVLQSLSPTQQYIVARHNITQLSRLDLAALLQTLENNWRNLDAICAFPPGALNFVKETRAIRNRWSHRSAIPDYVPDDIYRDLDTLGRFLLVVEAPDSFLKKVQAERLAMATEVLKAYSVNVPDQKEEPAPLTAQNQSSRESDGPHCPVCGNAMALRTARTGAYTGNQFWGCTEWSVTGCNGIVNLPRSQDASVEPPPTCPNCQNAMVLRTARNGPHAGRRFWGCSAWGITGCDGLLNIPQNPAMADVDDLPF